MEGPFVLICLHLLDRVQYSFLALWDGVMFQEIELAKRIICSSFLCSPESPVDMLVLCIVLLALVKL